jgi:hypothetical protein
MRARIRAKLETNRRKAAPQRKSDAPEYKMRTAAIPEQLVDVLNYLKNKQQPSAEGSKFYFSHYLFQIVEQYLVSAAADAFFGMRLETVVRLRRAGATWSQVETIAKQLAAARKVEAVRA